MQERPTFAAIRQHGARRHRAWRNKQSALMANVARLDARTGGHLGLVHNWGSDAARAAVARSDARWRRYADAMDKRYRELCRADVLATGGNPSF